MMDQDKTALTWIFGGVALVAVGVCVWLLLHPRIATLTKTEYQSVPVESVVTKVVKVPVIVKVPIQVYDKRALAAALPAGVQLPELAAAPAEADGALPADGKPAIAPSSGTEIIANGELQPSENGASLFTLLDTNTGEATIVAREIPAPLYAFENRGQAALWYGYNQHLQPVYQSDLQWSFLRVKEMHLGLRLQGSTDSGLFGGAGILYRW